MAGCFIFYYPNNFFLNNMGSGLDIGHKNISFCYNFRSDMARPLRIEYEGAFYHITSRGNERKSVFFDKTDYERFKSYLFCNS